MEGGNRKRARDGDEAVAGLGSANNEDGGEETDDYTPFVTVKMAKEARASAVSSKHTGKLATLAAEREAKAKAEAEAAAAAAAAAEPVAGPRARVSLMDPARELRAAQDALPDAALLRRIEEEKQLLAQASNVQVKSLTAVSERAKGVVYTEAIQTGWRPPAHIRALSHEAADAMRAKWHILVEGDDIPLSRREL